MAKLVFSVGNHKLHKDPNFNFQLNRTHAIGVDLEEIKAIATQVTGIPSYVELMKKAAEKVRAEGRYKLAVAFLRGQEFFTTAAEGKAAVYEDYKKMFYQVNGDLIKENNVQRAEVPYENGFLPVLYCINPNPKGVVVIHGGFDSYIEEHLKIMIYMFHKGYSAYIFEGPGQGEVLHRYGIPFTPDWHRPVGAVLDYFNLDNVALMGISMGSLLCKRAAAKEKRVKYLCSVGIMTSLYESNFARMPKELVDKLRKLMVEEKADEVNEIIYGLMDKLPFFSWAMNQSMNVFRMNTPYDTVRTTKAFDIAPIAAEITQDYICIAGQNDHFFPLSFSHDEIDRMQNARSFTLRIITAKEHGDDHCNVSNRKLMLDVFLNWLEETKKQIAEAENY